MVAGNHYGHVLADKLEARRERGRRAPVADHARNARHHARQFAATVHDLGERLIRRGRFEPQEHLGGTAIARIFAVTSIAIERYTIGLKRYFSPVQRYFPRILRYIFPGNYCIVKRRVR